MWCSAAGKVAGACGASLGGLAWGWAAGVGQEGSVCLPGFQRALEIKERVYVVLMMLLPGFHQGIY